MHLCNLALFLSKYLLNGPLSDDNNHLCQAEVMFGAFVGLYERVQFSADPDEGSRSSGFKNMFYLIFY